jgi:hypothetical protein
LLLRFKILFEKNHCNIGSLKKSSMKKLVVLIAALYSITGFAQNANFRRDSLYQILKQAQNPAAKVRAWAVISEDYGYTGQPDSSRFASEQMLKIATGTYEDSLLAKAYLDIGYYFSLTSDFKQSLEFEFKSLTLAESAKSSYDIWLASKELGVNFKQLKNYREALKYLKKSEPFLKDASLIYSYAPNRTYTNMSEVFLGLGQPDSALRFIQLANESTSKDKDPYGFARTLYIFASVYKAKGDTDIAGSYYKKCIAFSGAENILQPYVNASTDYGQYLLNAGEYKQSKQYVLRGFIKAKDSRYKLGVINSAGLLRTVYAALGLKDSAYYYAVIKDAYRDSVFNDQQTNQIQNLYFTEQIKENETEARISEELHQQHQNIQFVLIAFGIIAFIILFLLFSRSIVANERFISFFGVLGLLVVFEFINLLFHPWLALVTHESPVLMLIALVLIASLLIPLHHRLEKWIKEKMIEKNKVIRLVAAKKTIEKLEKNT